MKNFKLLSILNFAAFLFHLLLSILSNIKGVLSDNTVADISHKYETIFTPAGITFSIWGVIYVFLLGFCIYHLYNAFTKPASNSANRDTVLMSWLFIINNLATGFWLIAWVNDYLFLSVVLIFIQLGTLLSLILRLGIFDIYNSLVNKVLTQTSLSIYFAWICIATIANISAYLVSIGYASTSSQAFSWTIAVCIFATIISIFTIINRRNVVLGLVVVWAFYGIILKNQNLDSAIYANILKTLWFCVGIIGATTVIQYFKNEKLKRLKGISKNSKLPFSTGEGKG